MSEPHEPTVDSRIASVPTDHLDRAWPDTGRASMKQVAAWRAPTLVRYCRNLSVTKMPIVKVGI
jgi:hypothetical protein